MIAFAEKFYILSKAVLYDFEFVNLNFFVIGEVFKVNNIH